MKLLRKLLAGFRKPGRNYESRDGGSNSLPLHHYFDPITDVMMEDYIARRDTMSERERFDGALALLDRSDREFMALAQAVSEVKRQGKNLILLP
jgi:hypothetical protein